MGAGVISGNIRLSNVSKMSHEEIFHKFLSEIKPEKCELRRISIYEAPIRAVLEYKATGQQNINPVINVHMLENDNVISYSIDRNDQFQPDEKTYFPKFNKMLRRLKSVQ